MSQATIAVIVGNRDFFPDCLITEGRREILNVFKELNIEPVILDETDTKLGAVETWTHAKHCASFLFAQRSGQLRLVERNRRRPGQGEDNPNRKGAAGNGGV